MWLLRAAHQRSQREGEGRRERDGQEDKKGRVWRAARKMQNLGLVATGGGRRWVRQGGGKQKEKAKLLPPLLVLVPVHSLGLGLGLDVAGPPACLPACCLLAAAAEADASACLCLEAGSSQGAGGIRAGGHRALETRILLRCARPSENPKPQSVQNGKWAASAEP